MADGAGATPPIARSPSLKRLRVTECGICNEPLGEAVAQLRCGHAFCSDCIVKWVQERPTAPTCPQCRARFGGTVRDDSDDDEEVPNVYLVPDSDSSPSSESSSESSSSSSESLRSESSSSSSSSEESNESSSSSSEESSEESSNGENRSVRSSSDSSDDEDENGSSSSERTDEDDQQWRRHWRTQWYGSSSRGARVLGLHGRRGGHRVGHARVRP